MNKLWRAWVESYAETKFFFLACFFVFATCASLCAGAL